MSVTVSGVVGEKENSQPKTFVLASLRLNTTEQVSFPDLTFEVGRKVCCVHLLFVFIILIFFKGLLQRFWLELGSSAW